jgi:hypothetical protein
MRSSPLFALLLSLTVAVPAFAEDTGGGLAVGGALQQAAEGTRTSIWSSGNVVAGFGAPAVNPASTNDRGMQLGGFLAWRDNNYRLDATLAPSPDGSLTAGLGASTGASPGELGTSYSLRLGTDRASDRFTVNSAIGLSDVIQPNSDVNLTVTINHALTPSLNIVGTAEARRNLGSGMDSGQSRYLFGAGLGYRF